VRIGERQRSANQTYHLEDLWSTTRRIADTVIYQLDDPIVSTQPFEQVNLVKIICNRLSVGTIQLNSLESEDLSISWLKNRIDLGRTSLAEKADPFVLLAIELYNPRSDGQTHELSQAGLVNTGLTINPFLPAGKVEAGVAAAISV